MNLGLVFFQFLPLLLYIGFEYWKGFRAGILAAIAGSIVMVSYDYFTTGAVDSFSIGECGLILFLGIVSLRMNNERYFKFQPTVLALIFAIVFIYFELKGTPLLVRYIPQIEKLFVGQEHSPEIEAFLANLHSADSRLMLARLSRFMIAVFLGHGLVMAYAALRLSTPKWFMWRLAIYPAVVVATMIVAASAR